MIALFKFLVFSKIGRVIAAFLLGGGVFASVYVFGGYQARLKDRADNLESALTIEQERARDDATLQSLSDADLCKRYFRDAGRMPNPPECRALRGLHGKQP